MKYEKLAREYKKHYSKGLVGLQMIPGGIVQVQLTEPAFDEASEGKAVLYERDNRSTYRRKSFLHNGVMYITLEEIENE